MSQIQDELALEVTALRADVAALRALLAEAGERERASVIDELALRAEIERLRGPREPPHCPTCDCGIAGSDAGSLK